MSDIGLKSYTDKSDIQYSTSGYELEHENKHEHEKKRENEHEREREHEQDFIYIYKLSDCFNICFVRFRNKLKCRHGLNESLEVLPNLLRYRIKTSNGGCQIS